MWDQLTLQVLYTISSQKGTKCNNILKPGATGIEENVIIKCMNR